MPANYSAIAENEMTYVVGGESLFPVFNPLSTLFTNVVNIIGDIFGGIGDTIKNRYNAVLETKVENGNTVVTGGQFNGVLNAGAAIMGGMAAVAQLMNNDVKVYTKENVVKFN